MNAKTTRSRNSGRPPRSAGRRLNKFKTAVLGYYRAHGRHALPWRKTRDPYRILVSEVMLQQTQVERVIPFYMRFLKKFPSVRALARASLAEVLRAWQGLGYNRRGKMLHEAAQAILEAHGGALPRSYEELHALPGVGDYTAKAVRVFAFNEPEALIETNVRTVFLHHFFPKKKGVSDAALMPLIAAALHKNRSREWYSALMDYGAHLKSVRSNPSRRSAHHAKQKPFKGSDREIRGAILRAHLGRMPLLKLPFDKKRIRAQVKKLRAEGLLVI